MSLISTLPKPGKFVIISVIGPHAGEAEDPMFERKRNEIVSTGRSFWFMRSPNAKPEQVRKICREAARNGDEVYCVLIRGSSKGSARDTKPGERADEFSVNRIHWKKISRGINAVSSMKSGYALVFDRLQRVDGNFQINLWDYSKYETPGKAIKIRQGASTLCAGARSSAGDPDKMKSNLRQVIAIGQLASPYGVYVRRSGH